MEVTFWELANFFIYILDLLSFLMYYYCMKGKEIIRKLKKEGWTLSRIVGSHHIMQKNGKGIPIPVHGHKDIGKGLIAKIERDTGVKL